MLTLLLTGQEEGGGGSAEEAAARRRYRRQQEEERYEQMKYDAWMQGMQQEAEQEGKPETATERKTIEQVILGM